MTTQLLLVDDSPGDVRLTQEAFRDANRSMHMHVAMDGREVLARIKADGGLKTIPTVILTTSEAEADIVKSYQLQANCYLSKPVQLDEFESLVRVINDFWLINSRLPQQMPNG